TEDDERGPRDRVDGDGQRERVAEAHAAVAPGPRVHGRRRRHHRHDGEATRERAGAAEPEPAREGDAAGDGAGRCPLDEREQREYAAIDRRAEEIVGLGERIRKHPELGFKEVKTARLIEETLAGLGLKPKTGLGLTGVRAEAPGRAGDGPTFALLGELDALVVAGHPDGDPATGAAHACGHNAQVAALM